MDPYHVNHCVQSQVDVFMYYIRRELLQFIGDIELSSRSRSYEKRFIRLLSFYLDGLPAPLFPPFVVGNYRCPQM